VDYGKRVMKNGKSMHNKIADYFFKNIIKVFSSLGIFLGMTILLSYYTQLHYQPIMANESLLYVVISAAFGGILMLLSLIFCIFSISMASRLVLPTYLPENLENRFKLIISRIAIPHFFIILLVIVMLNCMSIKNSAFIIFLTIPISSTIFAAVGRFMPGKGKTQNNGSDFWGFFWNYMFTALFYMVFLALGGKSIDDSYGILDRILFETGFVAFFIGINIFSTASFVKMPLFLLRLKVTRKDEPINHLAECNEPKDKKIFLWTTATIIFSLVIMLVFPSQNGNFFVKIIAEKYGIYSPNKEILINKEGCEIAKLVAVPGIKIINQNICKIFHINILSGLGEEYLLEFVKEGKSYRFRMPRSFIKTSLEVVELRK